MSKSSPLPRLSSLSSSLDVVRVDPLDAEYGLSQPIDSFDEGDAAAVDDSVDAPHTHNHNQHATKGNKTRTRTTSPSPARRMTASSSPSSRHRSTLSHSHSHIDPSESSQFHTPSLRPHPHREFDITMIQQMSPQEILDELHQSNYRTDSYKRAYDSLRRHLTSTLEPSRIAGLNNRIMELEGHLKRVLEENKTLQYDIKRFDRQNLEARVAHDAESSFARQESELDTYKTKYQLLHNDYSSQEIRLRREQGNVHNLEMMCRRLVERAQTDADKIERLQAQLMLISETSASNSSVDEKSPTSNSNTLPPSTTLLSLQSHVFMDRAALHATKKLNDEMIMKENERKRLKVEVDRQKHTIAELTKTIENMKQQHLQRQQHPHSHSHSQAPPPQDQQHELSASSVPSQPSPSQSTSQQLSPQEATKRRFLSRSRSDTTLSTPVQQIQSATQPVVAPPVAAVPSPSAPSSASLPSLTKSPSSLKHSLSSTVELTDPLAAAAARRLRRSEEKAKKLLMELHQPPIHPWTPTIKPKKKQPSTSQTQPPSQLQAQPQSSHQPPAPSHPNPPDTDTAGNSILGDASSSDTVHTIPDEPSVDDLLQLLRALESTVSPSSPMPSFACLIDQLLRERHLSPSKEIAFRHAATKRSQKQLMREARRNKSHGSMNTSSNCFPPHLDESKSNSPSSLPKELILSNSPLLSSVSSSPARPKRKKTLDELESDTLAHQMEEAKISSSAVARQPSPIFASSPTQTSQTLNLEESPLIADNSSDPSFRLSPVRRQLSDSGLFPPIMSITPIDEDKEY